MFFNLVKHWEILEERSKTEEEDKKIENLDVFFNAFSKKFADQLDKAKNIKKTEILS